MYVNVLRHRHTFYPINTCCGKYMHILLLTYRYTMIRIACFQALRRLNFNICEIVMQQYGTEYETVAEWVRYFSRYVYVLCNNTNTCKCLFA